MLLQYTALTKALGVSSYLEHLISIGEGITGQQVGIALPVRLPRDAGFSLGFLREPCLVKKRGSDGKCEFQNRLSTALCIREGDKDQGLTVLLIGRLWVASIIELCVLNMLALTPNHILVGSCQMDSVVINFRHIQIAKNPGAVGLRQRLGKQGVWLWAGETGLGQAG